MEPTSRFGLFAESIDGAEVRIRRYRDSDVADVQAGCNDPLTQRFLPLLPTPYTRADAQWWVDEGARPAFDNGGANFAIADLGTDRLLGGVGVTHQRDGNGEIGYWVAPWGRHRGVATAATHTLSEYAFSAGYGRLQLRTEYENTSSQRVAISAGYLHEGVQRGAGLTRTGTRHDLMVWSRLVGDPPGPTVRLLPDLPQGHLTDGVVTLEPLGPADADDLQATTGGRDAWTWPGGAPADAEQVSARAGAHWLAGTAAHVAIRDAASGVYAGDVALDYHLPEAATGSIGYAVMPAWRDRDHARRAVRLLVRWALHDAGLSRLTACTGPDNLAAQRVLEAARFVRAGYLPGAVGLRGAVDAGGDTVLYALLRSAG